MSFDVAKELDAFKARTAAREKACNLETVEERYRFNSETFFDQMASASPGADANLMRSIASVIAAQVEINRTLRIALEKRVQALEKSAGAQGGVSDKATSDLAERIAALEENSLHDGGVFESGKSYRKGAIVTNHGQSWLARSVTASVPGSDQTWRLLAHRGKDKR